MSKATLKSYLLQRTAFLGLRPASATDAEDAVEPALAGSSGGLVVEGVAGGTPMPVSGTVTATVDTSALATGAKQDAAKAVLDTLATEAKQDTLITAAADILAKLIAAPATEALQTAGNALLGTIRNLTTPSKTDAATGPLEVDATGNAHVSATLASHQIVALQGPVTTALTEAQIAAMTVTCDGIEADLAAMYVYAQLREDERLAPITAAGWSAGAGWSFAGTIATHADGGGTNDLETVLDVAHLGIPYALVYTISGMTQGTLTEKIGTAAGAARAADGTYVQLIIPTTVDGKVHLTPSDDFDGGLDIEGLWVLPYHHLPNAGVAKPLAASMIAAIATEAAPTAKVISPATVCLRTVSYRRAGAVQS